ncbi:MAG: M20/M25/M40 family metallo-hydrolase [Lentisphaerae bacterium]|jgi:succinyl-diaminopimelate desuccinylase|nr:M20/M25/M40 family metallo-hydrolase [Lentisphaerota bacterium]MBT4820604.1 M20/M25/M40 family metallo-hydrolase [Lentisphaerota bacterium]MBT5604516.1 M20/M25/M40 family metallo-hydrolase [Lentisphaerota bacterium]MBT7057672.1 M20/M25/M40 family metallo-hydrolase [Lentisphaerota bacterium]MBT7841639.1 M20/M25/M40 family metallo-hydrolase [Lentisphaerota bacterium]
MKPSVELLRELMACRPITRDVERVNEAVDVMAEYLAGEGIHMVVEMLGERKILYSSTCPGRTPSVLLNAHLDVVPAEDDLFELREEDGWLYGRGTQDCIGNSVVAAQTLVRVNGELDLGVVFSTDEEIGGETTATMVEKGYTAEDMILALDGANYAITIAQKGVLTVVLRALGTACHGAEPWRGDNAIDKLIDGYVKIRGLFPSVTPPDEWQNTMIAAKIEAGTVSNRVPDIAEMTLNIRYIEAGGDDVILQQLHEVSGLEVIRREQCPPVVFSEDTPAFTRLAQCMDACLSKRTAIVRMNGATDARHFVTAGVPIGIIGIPGGNPHATNERITCNGMNEYEDMLVTFLKG